MGLNGSLKFNFIVKDEDFIVRDHQLHGVHIMPGVTFLDTVYRFLKQKGFDTERIELRNILFKEPVVTSESFDKIVQVILENTGNFLTLEARSRKYRDGQILDEEWNLNFQGEVHLEQEKVSKIIDIEVLKKSAVGTMDMDVSYAHLRKCGLYHYERMKLLGAVYEGNDYLLAELQLGELAKQYIDSLYIHPTYLDGTSCVPTIVMLSHPEVDMSVTKPFIPIFIGRFRALDILKGTCYVYVKKGNFTVSQSKDIMYSDIEIYDEMGKFAALYEKFGAKQVRTENVIKNLGKGIAVGNSGANTDKAKNLAQLGDLGFKEPTPRNSIEKILRNMVGNVLGISEENVSDEEGFYDQGLDSGNLLKLVRDIEKGIGRTLYPTLLFEYTNIQKLAKYLEKEFGVGAFIKLEKPLEQSGEYADGGYDLIRDELRRMVAGVVGKSDEDISLEEGFYNQGLDSTNLLQLVKTLEERISHKLYPTLLFEYTNINSLAEYLEKEFGNNIFSEHASNGTVYDGEGYDGYIEEENINGFEANKRDFYYCPRWVYSPIKCNSQRTNERQSGKSTIVIAYTPNGLELKHALEKLHQEDKVLGIELGTESTQYTEGHWKVDSKDEKAIDNIISGLSRLDIIYFLGGIQDLSMGLNDMNALELSQQQGVYSLFRMVKSIGKNKLIQGLKQLKVITNNVCEVIPGEKVIPYVASLQGLARGIACEYQSKDISCIDIDLGEVSGEIPQDIINDVVREIIREPGNSQGDMVAIRRGERYVQRVEPLELPDVKSEVFRKQGVYLILGGAGGIGLQLGHYLAEGFGARIVLIGRSQPSDAQKEMFSEIESKGGSVLYIQADATNFDGMKEAVAKAKEAYGTINGVIHSAIVLRDRTIESMDEEILREALKPKVEGSFILYNVLKDEPLDFMAFFSSTQSLFVNVGQSNYAAGCVFKDAYAAAISHEASFPVRIINWGYWGSVGVVANQYYNQKLSDRGIMSIEPTEGMKAIQTILGSRLLQVAAMKVGEDALKRSGVGGSRKKIYYDEVPSLIEAITDNARKYINEKDVTEELKSVRAFKSFERFGRCLLLSAFRRMGAFRFSDESYDKDQLKVRLGIIPAYNRLFDALIELMANEGFISIDENKVRTLEYLNNDKLKEELKNKDGFKKQLIEEFTDVEPHIELEWICINALPDILTGRKSYMSVMFPKGSMELVEKIYRGNKITDYYNGLVAEVVKLYCSQRLADDPGTRISILEVGAGTGGTSHFVLKAIEGFDANIRYLYTDISVDLTLNNNEFGKKYPFVEFKSFNVEKDPEKQGFEPGSIDLIFASNVLHATKDMDNSLNQTKKLLKTNGLIVINEVTEFQDFTTLTFGLTSGWWLYSDEENRIKNSPVIGRNKWESILNRNGIRKVSILGLPENVNEESGQNIIIGESDGAVVYNLIETDKTNTAVNNPKTFVKSVSMSSDLTTKSDLRPQCKLYTEDIENRDIAIIGVSGRYPKAHNLNEFWENLKNGRDCITEIPADRWDVNRYFDEDKDKQGISYSKWGGFIDDVDKFDPLFFNISPKEADLMDPQERLFLETVWQTIEDAGYTRLMLKDSVVGVFAGVMWGQYQLIGADELAKGNPLMPNSIYASIANRVSYYFDFKGPSIALDTMCSSSLTAIHLACESIRKKECDVAIAGGVNVSIHPSKYIFICNSKMASTDGRCRSFGEGGDGFVPGEGFGAVLLKPLKKAIADGDYIHGIIKGSAVNHGGRVSGFSVPSPSAQGSVIREALKKAAVDPSTVSYIETHGTGTSLGDPIEVMGLIKAFEEGAGRKQYCSIGSVKSNIGHLESAAGIAGLTKILLQMKHQKLVPSLHSEKLNSNIEFEKSPFYVQHKLADWKKPMVEQNGIKVTCPRRAGISSFGAGGSNVHIVVEEYERPVIDSCGNKNEPLIFTLSAKNKERLKEYTGVLYQHIKNIYLADNGSKSADNYEELYRIAYTLQTGREAMNERLAIVASSMGELTDCLSNYSEQMGSNHSIYIGSVKSNVQRNSVIENTENEKAEILDCIKNHKWDKLAMLWVKGADVEWQVMYPENVQLRMPLPAYPFAKERYWLKQTDNNAVLNGSNVSPWLHPLIERNVSTLFEQKFALRLRGSEFYLADHIIGNSKVLPGVTILEMARAAGELSGIGEIRRISGIVWTKPIVVDNSGNIDAQKDIFISLYPKDAEVEFEIWSNDKVEGRILHAHGNLDRSNESESTHKTEKKDIEVLKKGCDGRFSSEECYKLFADFGFKYGKRLRGIKELYFNENETLAYIELPEGLEESFGRYKLHPSILDAALQAVIGISERNAKQDNLSLPFAIGEVEIKGAFPDKCFAYVKYTGCSKYGVSQEKRFDVLVLNQEGYVVTSIRDFILRDSNKQHKSELVKVNSFDMLYLSNTWLEKDTAPRKKISEQNILVFGRDKRIWQKLHDRFTGENAKFILVLPEKAYREADKLIYEINPLKPEDYNKLMDSLDKKGLHPHKILHLWSCGSLEFDKALFNEQLENGVYPILYISQALSAQKLKDMLEILYVYPGNEHTHPQFAAVSGLAKSISLENSKLAFRTIQTGMENIEYEDGGLTGIILKELENQGNNNEREISYRNGKRFIKKLYELSSFNGNDGVELKNNGVYIITGGAGGLGLIFADYLARKYKARLVLTGRSLLNAQKEQKIRELGADVLYFRSDILNYEQAKELITYTKKKFGFINGIIHSAGIVRDSLIKSKTKEEMNFVISPKLYGTLWLDQALADENLDFFAMFSSISSVMGNVGQCDYAFGNNFMDCYAKVREDLREKGKRKGKTVSINWPLWQAGGMKVDAETENWLLNSEGVAALSSEMGLRVFEKALKLDASQVIALYGNRTVIEERIGLNNTETYVETEKYSTQDEVVDERLEEKVSNFLKDILSREIGLPAAKILTEEALEEYGIDSVMVVHMTRELERCFGSLPKTLFYEYQTIGELTKYLINEHYKKVSEKFGEAVKPLQVSAADVAVIVPQSLLKSRFIADDPKDSDIEIFKSDDIAIIGLAGRYPMADSLDEFWDNLKAGKDCITEIPKERWDYQKYFGGDGNKTSKMYNKWGGFINDIDKFDPLFFNISPREAEMMDPQERLFLETAWNTFEDAGYTRERVGKNKVGLFVGVMYGQYQLFGAEEIMKGNIISPNSSFASIANRVSYYFNFHGPSIAVDTMCSSSLTAIHLACTSINKRECEIALAGGVNASIHPSKYFQICDGKFASSDGKCRSFGTGGDGYVPGEGVGAILLKPLKKAIIDGDNIYAIIKGSSINHGGKTNGYTVPNPNAQAELITEALRKTGVNPREISYIEAHGTGTSLGDPIEITGLMKAYSDYTVDKEFCSIGSVKSNVGHLESAAGIAGLTKVLLQMKHKKLVPSIHSDTLNPNIDFEASPFKVQRRLEEWDRPVASDRGIMKEFPRLAGISSFGAGGSNAHIILKEYEDEDAFNNESDEDAQIIVLSAKNDERLKIYADKIARYLKNLWSDSVSNICEDDRVCYLVQDEIKDIVAKVINVDKGVLTADEDLNEYGIDVVAFSEVAAGLNRKYGIEIGVFLFTGYPSIRGMSQQLYSKFKDNLIKCYQNNVLRKEKPQQNIRLSDIAFTLQVGREAMEERLAVVVTSIEELIDKLLRYCSGETDIENLFVGNARISKLGQSMFFDGKESEEFIKIIMSGRKLDKLAKMWAAGININLEQLYPDVKKRRITLPTYPFKRERYWLPVSSKSVGFEISPQKAKLHPLIEKNISDLEEQKYSITFTGDEFFLEDHKVGENKVLPGVAYLEMVRAAGTMAAKSPVKKIRNTVWAKPIIAESNWQNEDNKEICISLYPDGDEVKYEVWSEEKDEERIVYAQGGLLYKDTVSTGNEGSFDIDAFKNGCTSTLSSNACYDIFSEGGLNYGPGFRSIKKLYISDESALSYLELPEVLTEDLSSFQLHPTIMDGALQTVIGLIMKSTGEKGVPYLPYTLGEVEIIRPLCGRCYAYAVAEKTNEASKIKKFTISIYDESGRILLKIKDLIIKSFGQTAAAPGTKCVFYHSDWQLTANNIPKEKQQIYGNILVLGMDNNVPMQIAERTQDGEIIIVKPGEEFRRVNSREYVINPAAPEDYSQLMEELRERKLYPDHVLQLWPAILPHAEKSPEARLDTGIWPVFYLSKEIIKNPVPKKIRLLYVHLSKDGHTQPLDIAMSGFAKTVRLENSNLLYKVLEIDQTACQTTDWISMMCYEMAVESDDIQVRYENGSRWVKKINKLSLSDGAGSVKTIKQNGVYLITGGAGGLGLVFARYFADKAKVKLVLAGRSELNEDRMKKIRELESKGSEVVYIKADVSKREDVERLINFANTQYGRINGIIHSAGVLRDSALSKKSRADMEAVIAPKVYGTFWLDEFTKNEEIDFFVLFSSVSSIMGNAGQCDYSFGNAYMDSYAEYREELRKRKERSGRTVSINWPLWRNGGMTVDSETEALLFTTLGMEPLDDENGFYAFEKGLGWQGAQFAVVKGDHFKIRKIFEGKTEKELPEPSDADSSMDDMGNLESSGIVLGDLMAIVSQILKINKQDIDPEAQMSDFGFDSITFTQLSNQLNEKYDTDVMPSVFFEHSSLASLVDYLTKAYKGQISRYYDTGAAKPLQKKIITKEYNNDSLNIETALKPKIRTFRREICSTIAEKMQHTYEPIAVIGMSGVMPQSENLEEFWSNLEKERDLITEIPGDRWDWKEWYGDPTRDKNKTNIKWGGFMKEVDKFDSLFFGISPREAELMDPQQRIFMETVWKTIEDAGYKAADLSGTKTGIFVGVASSDYTDVLKENYNEIQSQTLTGLTRSMLVNRISFLLNLNGPSEPIDTACSSSLVAVHKAVEAIHNGDCESAIVGGVNVMVRPELYISLNKAGMLCEDGRCKTFDSRANGYVRGEGVGAVFLKPLDKAERDGDHIYAVIKGSAINHGGHANSLTAPNPNAQADLLIDSYTRANIDPTTVTYIEAHGTGTALGDPIEINGLKKAFEHLYKILDKPYGNNAHCALGSVKTNIGHLETAAGIAGILKILLAMKYGKLPASINFNELNPYIQIEGSPFYINSSTKPWEHLNDGGGKVIPRRAGISSFGFGGVNAHVVLEEYIPEGLKPISREPQVFVLSAKNEDRLREYARNFTSFIIKSLNDGTCLNIENMALTLQVGREAMEERLALVTDDVDELVQKLELFGRGENEVQDLYRGNIKAKHLMTGIFMGGKSGEDFIKTVIKNNEFTTIAKLWVNGIDIDWMLLCKGYSRQRIPLPSYPFLRERHWAQSASAQKNSIESVIHPLLGGVDIRQSMGKGIVFRKILKNKDLIFKHHRVNDCSVLPGVGFLELAFSAASNLAARQDVIMSNALMLNPLFLNGDETEVSVAVREEDGVLLYEVRSRTGDTVALHSKGGIQIVDDNVENNDICYNLDEIKRRCSFEIGNEELYSGFENGGLNYGPYFRGVNRVWANTDEALGLLIIPDEYRFELGQYFLQPTLADGALQVVAGIMYAQKGKRTKTMLPFSVGRVQIIRPLKEKVYAYVKAAGENSFDIVIVDEEGLVCIKIEDMAFREMKDSLQDFFFMPQWKPFKIQSDYDGMAARSLKDSGKVLFIYSADAKAIKDGVASLFHKDKVFYIKLGSTERRFSDNSFEIDTFCSDSIKKLIIQAGEISTVYFLGGISEGATDIENIDVLEQSQEKGIVSLFRLIKALLDTGMGLKKLILKVITNNVLKVINEEAVNPFAGSIHGFIKSVGKEQYLWEVSCIDIDYRLGMNKELAGQIAEFPGNRNSEEVAIRNGIFYERIIVPVALPNVNGTPFKMKGVYMILGGAGGIGLELGLYLAKKVQARLVLIGRGQLDSGKKAKIAKMEQMGGEVLYIQADATDNSSMNDAVRSAKERFGKIDGAIHSAIVLKDRKVENMDEETLRSVLAPKVKGSVMLYKALKNEKLDFMMFFSSAQSIVGNAGQSNYAAACTFKDTYASYLQESGYCPVRIVNWGYWGEVGIVATEEYNRSLKAQGVESISVKEGMEAIQRILSNNIKRVMPMKTDKAVLNRMKADMSHRIRVNPQAVPSLVNSICAKTEGLLNVPKKFDEISEAYNAIKEYSGAALLNVFRKMGIFQNKNEQYERNELKSKMRIIPEYWRLYDAMLGILERAGFISMDRQKGLVAGKAILDSEELEKRLKHIEEEAVELENKFHGVKAHLKLLCTCLESYDKVLVGEKNHMEVMFPSGSKTLVENVYKGNESADYYNNIVADVVKIYIDERLKLEPHARINILEVGAGTGGTSTFVLEKIKGYSNNIRYYYTDVSIGFTQYGSRTFGETYPFTEFKVLDVESNPETQGFDADSIDIAFGSNVIHATRSISNTLKQIKRVLKTNGILIINEVTEIQDFVTLIFGLTEGWWLYEDADRRLECSPLLSTSRWTEILNFNGFSSIRALGVPGIDEDKLQQGIIIGENDGMALVENTIEKEISKEPEYKHQKPIVSAAQKPRKDIVSDSDIKTKNKIISAVKVDFNQFTSDYVKEVFSKVLRIDKAKIDSQATFENYGVDSLIVMEINREFEKSFGKLPSSLLFEYINVEKLTEYFMKEHNEKIKELLLTQNDPMAENTDFQYTESHSPIHERVVQEHLTSQGIKREEPEIKKDLGNSMDDAIDCLSDEEVDMLLNQLLDKRKN